MEGLKYSLTHGGMGEDALRNLLSRKAQLNCRGDNLPSFSEIEATDLRMVLVMVNGGS